MTDNPLAALLAEQNTDPRRRNGWYGMACWNALSVTQQRTLIEKGVLPIGYQAEGSCPNPAEVEIETRFDEAPGPRFYCLSCAVAYLREVEEDHDSYVIIKLEPLNAPDAGG